jgi:hypothetical protein
MIIPATPVPQRSLVIGDRRLSHVDGDAGRRIRGSPYPALCSAGENSVATGIGGIDRNRRYPARNLVIVLKSRACAIGGKRHWTQGRPSSGQRWQR